MVWYVVCEVARLVCCVVLCVLCRCVLCGCCGFICKRRSVLEVGGCDWTGAMCVGGGRVVLDGGELCWMRASGVRGGRVLSGVDVGRGRSMKIGRWGRRWRGATGDTKHTMRDHHSPNTRQYYSLRAAAYDMP